MKKKITNEEIIALLKCINQLPSANKSLPVKFLYALNKSRGKLKGPSEDAERTRISLVEKFGNKDKKTDVTKVSEDKMQAYIKEWTEILKESTEIEFHQYPYEDFEKEIPSIQGVDNIYLLFDYILTDQKEVKTIKNNQKKEEDASKIEPNN